MVRDHFALDVRFERGKDYTTAELFEIMPPSVLKVAKSWFYPLPDSFRPPKDFVDWIANVLRGGLVPITVIAKASEAVIPGATEMEIAELASALAEFWFRGVRRWHDLRLQRVCAAWGFARSSFYAMKSRQQATAERPPAKRRWPSRDLEAGEGTRRRRPALWGGAFWARLRVCRDGQRVMADSTSLHQIAMWEYLACGMPSYLPTS